MLLKIMLDQLVKEVNGTEGKTLGLTRLIDKSQYDTGKQIIKRFKILVQTNYIIDLVLQTVSNTKIRDIANKIPEIYTKIKEIEN